MNGRENSAREDRKGTQTEQGTVIAKLVKQLGEESLKCISCGFCDSVCPTYEESGYDPVITARGRAQLGNRLFQAVSSGERVDFSIGDSFYSCLDCHACLQICPTGVDAGKVSDLGRKLIASGLKIPRGQKRPEGRMIVSATMKYSNPLGVREDCADWADGIKFDRDSDTLLYTGNMYQLMAYSKVLRSRREKMGETVSALASGISAHLPSLLRAGSKTYDPATKGVMDQNLRNIVSLLRRSGIRFGYLGKEEPYPGTFIHDLGYVSEFAKYAAMVSDTFRSHGYRRIITLDPHTFELFRDVYPRYLKDFDFEILYYLDLVDRSLLSPVDGQVAFHEPCHFVLSRNPYNGPGELLSGITEVKHPERSGKKSFCCGGPAELLFGDLSEKVSASRFRQLKETGADRIVTSCPICLVNLSRDSTVFDISEILVQSMGRE